MKQFELSVEVDSKPGVMAAVCGTLASEQVSIRSFSANADGGKGIIRMVVSHRDRAKEALEAAGYTWTEREVVFLQIPDWVGVAAEVAKKLAEAGMDIQYIYGGCVPGNCFAVLGVEDAAKADEVLSK